MPIKAPLEQDDRGSSLLTNPPSLLHVPLLPRASRSLTCRSKPLFLFKHQLQVPPPSPSPLFPFPSPSSILPFQTPKPPSPPQAAVVAASAPTPFLLPFFPLSLSFSLLSGTKQWSDPSRRHPLPLPIPLPLPLSLLPFPSLISLSPHRAQLCAPLSPFPFPPSALPLLPPIVVAVASASASSLSPSLLPSSSPSISLIFLVVRHQAAAGRESLASSPSSPSSLSLFPPLSLPDLSPHRAQLHAPLPSLFLPLFPFGPSPSHPLPSLFLSLSFSLSPNTKQRPDPSHRHPLPLPPLSLSFQPDNERKPQGVGVPRRHGDEFHPDQAHLYLHKPYGLPTQQISHGVSPVLTVRIKQKQKTKFMVNFTAF